MPVSFKNDIKPLFRSIDVDHMKQYGVVLDDYAYMSDGAGDHAHARAVLNTYHPFSTPRTNEPVVAGTISSA